MRGGIFSYLTRASFDKSGLSPYIMFSPARLIPPETRLEAAFRSENKKNRVMILIMHYYKSKQLCTDQIETRTAPPPPPPSPPRHLNVIHIPTRLPTFPQPPSLGRIGRSDAPITTFRRLVYIFKIPSNTVLALQASSFQVSRLQNQSWPMKFSNVISWSNGVISHSKRIMKLRQLVQIPPDPSLMIPNPHPNNNHRCKCPSSAAHQQGQAPAFPTCT